MNKKKIDRRIAQFLERFPRIKVLIKKTYLFFFYITSKKKSKIKIARDSILKRLLPENKRKREEDDKEYFFGYFDKSPWSFDMKYTLTHSIRNDDVVDIIIVDTNGSVKTLGGSSTWNYQQGSMSQWVPGEKYNVLLNDIKDGNFISKIIDVVAGTERVLPLPVQALDRNGNKILALNYRRLFALRPEYGYDVNVNNFAPEMPLEKDGIWMVDIEEGSYELLISIKELIDYKKEKSMDSARHKINHIMFSPDGDKFLFMHRWITKKGKISRLYMFDLTSQKLTILIDEGMVSHYSWRDNDTIIAWARIREKGDAYFLININTLENQIVGEGVLDKYGDGHPTFSPCGRYILTDTYPDKSRIQHLLIYDTIKEEMKELGAFFAPWKYQGANRCDLHPRWSPDGEKISFDSTYEGYRKSYVLDISKVLEKSRTHVK